MNSPSPIRREVGSIALLFTGLGSIIGSGWLFGAWRAAGLAGSSAIWAWVLGAAIMTTIALTYAELGAMFPESGGTVRYGHYSHGSLVGFIAAWANWISTVSALPVEAEASVQYMASWPWRWAQDLYVHLPDGHGELTIGSTNLTEKGLYLYGSDRASIVESINKGRHGVMPSFDGKLSAAEIKAVSVFVFSRAAKP